ncbi:MAG TPA: DUF885 domain-containing protein [Candidatus Limnocylindria bacterium]|nr:DUF885 domain-containing protein [Candidatus Limnocylindria bacterium]
MREWSLFPAGAIVLVTLAVLGPGRALAGPSEDLAKLCEEYWEGHLRAHPTSATAIGDRRYDDRLDDNSPAGRTREQQRLESMRKRVTAIDTRTLAAADRVNRDALIEDVEGQLAQLSCEFSEWVVDPLDGPQVSFLNLADYTVIATPKDAANYVSRCRAMGRYVDQHVANLAIGLGKGKIASLEAVRKTIDQLRVLEGKPVEEWAMLGPLAADRPTWSEAQRKTFARDLNAAAREHVLPAFARYRSFLESKILPRARGPEQAGLKALPDGLECYRKMIRVHTSLDMSPDELHRLGLEQVAKFRSDLSELGGRALGTSDVAEIQKKLRSNPAMHFKTAEEIEGKAREALGRAEVAMAGWFGVLPKAKCEVKVMGIHEAPYSTIAYYRNPAKDGSRPGQYMINTYKPETRPRYEAEALAFHEAIPGHHLQIAIAQELTGLPEFRKYQGVTAYFEGWALYTERLADEMKLYSTDLDRIGMLSFDAWRACRLVVDTGLHAMGWSRQQAIDYMVENSVLADNNVVNEVDRYLTWPAQALAYKVGQLEILRLREDARRKLGARFDIKAFHDVVLRNGAVALPVLRGQVEAWVAAQSPDVPR